MRWLVVVLMLWTPRLSLAQGPSKEQRSFSPIEAVKRPATIPVGVLALLAEDEGVRQLLANEGIPVQRLPLSWFQASEVHLAGRKEKDLIVVGTGPVSGANVTTFWIFRPEGKRYESILNPPAVAPQLDIEKGRTSGYRDLQLLSAAAASFKRVN